MKISPSSFGSSYLHTYNTNLLFNYGKTDYQSNHIKAFIKLYVKRKIKAHHYFNKSNIILSQLSIIKALLYVNSII